MTTPHALHLASHFAKLEIVRLLLDRGAEANVKNKEGLTALHHVSLGQYESQEDGVRVAQLLLEHGTVVDSRDEGNRTPLHCASYFGKHEIVRLLLDHGAEVNAEDDDGEKPLHQVSSGEYSSHEDGLRVARLLLERGADVNAGNKEHQTPLHSASHFGKHEIVRLLLDHGAEVNAEDDDGEKPLHQVSYGEYGSQEDGLCVARLLLERGADVTTRSKEHRTLLNVASHFGNVEIVRLLLDHGADPETNAADDYGEKPLHRVLYGKYKTQEDGMLVAQLLLDCGADVNSRRKDQWTPLHLASYHGNAEFVQLLIDNGADVNAVDDFGKSPLHDVSQGTYESQEDGVRVAQLLLDHGADVSAKAGDGHTPLKLASLKQRPKLAELLLEHAANINAPTK
jgi:ankyrin repeat protein